MRLSGDSRAMSSENAKVVVSNTVLFTRDEVGQNMKELTEHDQCVRLMNACSISEPEGARMTQGTCVCPTVTDVPSMA